MTEWVLVPREPTAKMVLAAFDAITNASGEGMIRARWRCMLDAAPAAPQQAEPVAWVPVHESNGPLWSFAEDRKESLKDWPFPAAAVFLFPPDAEAVLNSYADENQQISDERDAAQAKVQRLRDALKPFAAIDLTTNQAVDAMDVLRARRALEGK
jgi:hypothetical protein